VFQFAGRKPFGVFVRNFLHLQRTLAGDGALYPLPMKK